jgi:hypothetical protein
VNKQVARELNYNNLDKPFLDFLIAPSERTGEKYIYLFILNKNNKTGTRARAWDLKKKVNIIFQMRWTTTTQHENKFILFYFIFK